MSKKKNKKRDLDERRRISMVNKLSQNVTFVLFDCTFECIPFLKQNRCTRKREKRERRAKTDTEDLDRNVRGTCSIHEERKLLLARVAWQKRIVTPGSTRC